MEENSHRELLHEDGKNKKQEKMKTTTTTAKKLKIEYWLLDFGVTKNEIPLSGHSQ